MTEDRSPGALAGGLECVMKDAECAAAAPVCPEEMAFISRQLTRPARITRFLTQQRRFQPPPLDSGFNKTG